MYTIFIIVYMPQKPSIIYGDGPPNYYNTALAQLISTYTDLVNKVQIQNNNLDYDIKKYSQDHSVDYKKSFYENQSIENLKSIYIYLFYIYFFLIFTIIFILLLNRKIFKIDMIILTIVLIVFPFFIYPLEQFIYSIFLYFYDFFTESIFSNVYITGNY